MGIIFSRIRKKKSTIAILEKLDNDIKQIEENHLNAQRKYKRITKLLLVWFLGLYVLYGITFYFQFTSTLQGKLLYLVPLAVSPLLLYIVKKIISWYYIRLMNKNQIILVEMKNEKKKILDEVMDKETYKVAKQILEKFPVESVPKSNFNVQPAIISKIDQGVRKRTVTATTSAPGPQLPSNRVLVGNQTLRPVSTPAPTRPMPTLFTGVPQLPAPILPLHRSYVDRVVEYLIGDGPNHRYALICFQCNSHNGMALKEEFEYIGFKCCYCFYYNPARKLRPEAPKLEVLEKPAQESDSDSEKTSRESSDGEHKLGEKLLKVTENLDFSNLNNINSKLPKSLDSSIHEANEEEDRNTTNKDPEEETNTTPLEENAVEKTQGQNLLEESINSDQPESDANCDQSSAKS